MDDKKLLFLIETAIEKEEEAYDFYRDLYGRIDDRMVKDTLRFIAAEEKKHKEFLVKYRNGTYNLNVLSMNQVVDNKIAEYLVQPDIKQDMASKDIYLVAAHRELQSHEFYLNLATIHSEGGVKDFLLHMAREELQHKEKMEYLYTNTAFPQTSGG